MYLFFMLILVLLMNVDVFILNYFIIFGIRKNVIFCLKVLLKIFGILEKVYLEYFCFGFLVICKDEFGVRYVLVYGE